MNPAASVCPILEQGFAMNWKETKKVFLKKCIFVLTVSNTQKTYLAEKGPVISPLAVRWLPAWLLSWSDSPREAATWAWVPVTWPVTGIWLAAGLPALASACTCSKVKMNLESKVLWLPARSWAWADGLLPPSAWPFPMPDLPETNWGACMG